MKLTPTTDSRFTLHASFEPGIFALFLDEDGVMWDASINDFTRGYTPKVGLGITGHIGVPEYMSEILPGETHHDALARLMTQSGFEV